jgi:uncharacterized protein YceH (UPF0502 family)
MIELTPVEARVIGCLLEKSVVTPDQYPLTLNALTNACNQKSSREPIMQLDQGTVQNAIRTLQAKHLVRVEENFKSNTEKYTQRLCNTPFSDYKFDPAQFAIVCVLLLRGPRTPGEIRANSGRLHTFADNNAVIEALATLMDGQGSGQGSGDDAERGPGIVVELPRVAGRRDNQYTHLFCGPIADATTSAPTLPADAPPGARRAAGDVLAQLEQRVTDLEQEVAALKARMEDAG